MTVELIPELPGPARLGRHIEHDPKSLFYAVEDRLFGPIATVFWSRRTLILDQGELGSCTGNAMTGWLGCSPFADKFPNVDTFDEKFAVQLYERATQLDNVPGQYPPDDTGSTGLAVAKAAKAEGYISAYHHAFTTKGMLRALQHGPVIIGINWYEGFDNPDPDGIVSIAGVVRGGHEVLVRGVDLESGLLHLDNSWGPLWGAKGSFSMTLDTWARLRREGADVTVPVP